MSGINDLIGHAYEKSVDAKIQAAAAVADGGTYVVLDRQTDPEQWREALGDEVPAFDLAGDRAALDPLSASQ